MRGRERVWCERMCIESVWGGGGGLSGRNPVL